MELSKLRHKIDEVDDELVQLFIKRMELSAQVADYKKSHNLPIFVPAREQEILQIVAEKSGKEMASYTIELYQILFTLSRKYQQNRNAASTPSSQESIKSHNEIRKI